MGKERFPSDRIPFLSDDKAASEDRKAFSAFNSGTLLINGLCRKLAENNNLPFVTAEQALNEYKITGWDQVL